LAAAAEIENFGAFQAPMTGNDIPATLARYQLQRAGIPECRFVISAIFQVDELKAELSKHKLSTTGKKDELKARLQDFLNSKKDEAKEPEAAASDDGPSPKKRKTAQAKSEKQELAKERATEATVRSKPSCITCCAPRCVLTRAFEVLVMK
jgi:hypothetical protein